MYALKFSKTYDFGIMEKNGIKHVLEDKYYADNSMFCVADGITRDFVDGTPMKYPENMEDVKTILEKYPNPSGAARAAKDCVNNVVTYLKEKMNAEEQIEREDLKKAVEYANFTIGKINEGREIDYLSEDEYACVSVGGVISEDRLTCYFIGDSGIKVLDKNYNTIFDTTLLQKNHPDFLIQYGQKLFPKTFNWRSTFVRKRIRKVDRNNLTLLRTGINNIGVLNGDEKALSFIYTYQIPLDKAKFIIAFSDGCEELLKTKEQIKRAIKNPESIREGFWEKTLIIYEKQ